MAKTAIRSALALALAANLAACGHHNPSRPFGAVQICPRGDHYVRPKDADDASRIAKRMLTDLFGAPAVLRQEPYHTTIDQDRWITRGTPPAGDTGAPYLVVIDYYTGCPVHLGRDE